MVTTVVRIVNMVGRKVIGMVRLVIRVVRIFNRMVRLAVRMSIGCLELLESSSYSSVLTITMARRIGQVLV